MINKFFVILFIFLVFSTSCAFEIKDRDILNCFWKVDVSCNLPDVLHFDNSAFICNDTIFNKDSVFAIIKDRKYRIYARNVIYVENARSGAIGRYVCLE